MTDDLAILTYRKNNNDAVHVLHKVVQVFPYPYTINTQITIYENAFLANYRKRETFRRPVFTFMQIPIGVFFVIVLFYCSMRSSKLYLSSM